MFLKQRKGYDTDEFYKDELIKKLRIEIENLKSQLKFETEISDGFVLNSGEYVVGNDLKPGRYSLKLIYGNDGRLETTGRNWVIENLGDKWNGISEYKNLSLKVGQKLIISGNVKILLQEEQPINITENVSIIGEKDKEINRLKKELKKTREELADLKESFNAQYFQEKFEMTAGTYIGGENLKVGYYDLQVLQGKGCIRMWGKNIFEDMGEDGIMEYKGLKIARRNKLEISGNLILKAVYKNIKSF